MRKAAIWGAIDAIGRGGLHVAVLIALARLLSPAEFGLMAMLALFVELGRLLIDSGFSQALIQRPSVSRTDESTIFFFTVGMAAGVALLLAVCAPFIARFYGHLILREMTWWMALNLLLNSFGSIHVALLMKELDFRALARCGVLASVVSGVVALAMAAYGWGVWSLVGQALVYTVAMVGLLWLLHPWRPIMTFSVESLRRYFAFGGYLLWTGLLATLHRNLYALLIGKLHSAQAVGYYNQARQFQDLPVRALSSTVGKVAFPIFSGIAHDKARLAGLLAKALRTIVFVTVPMMVGLILFAGQLVMVILGQKWLPMVPVLQALAIVGLVSPVNQLNLNALKAQGYTALNARIQIARLTIAISLLLVTSPYGIVAVAYGQALAAVSACLINTYFTGRLIGYGTGRQLREVLPYLLACLPMAAAAWLVERIDFKWLTVELLVSGLAAASVYLLSCRIARLEALTSVSALLRKD